MEKEKKSLSNGQKLFFVLGALCLLAVSVYASTVISDTEITTPQINSILYVEAGNASDIQYKLDNNEDSLIYIPGGDYSIVNQINVSNNNQLICVGPKTNLYAGADIDLFYISSKDGVINGCTINTSTVIGYSSSAIKFDEIARYEKNKANLYNVNIYGLKNSTNNDKGIEIRSDSANGVSWAVIQNTYIEGFNYGIYQESNHISAYINGNSFINVKLSRSTYGLYQNDTLGTGIDGNYYNIYMNGHGNTIEMAHIEGDRNTLQTFFWDANLVSGIGVNLTSTTLDNMLIDNLITSFAYINDDGSENLKLIKEDYYLPKNTILNNDLNVTGLLTVGNRIDVMGTDIRLDTVLNSDGRIRLKENGVESWVIHRDNNLDDVGTEVLSFDNSTGSRTLTLTQDGDIFIGDGLSQKNLTMTSPDGTEYSCGVANGGALTCS